MKVKSTWRAVHASLWGEGWFRTLPPSGPSARHLWLYLKTGPHVTSLECLFRAGEAALADEMGWTLEGFRECWGELERAGKVRADWSARVVWLPEEMGDGDPANPNVIVGWSRLVPAIPECDLKDEACKAIAAHCLKRAPLEKLPAWRDAVRRVFGEDTVSDTVSDTPPDTVSDTPPETKNKTRSKNKNTPPPTPSTVDERKAGGEGGDSQEEKDRHEEARAVVSHYMRAVEPPPRATAPAMLSGGLTAEALRLATDTYSAKAKDMKAEHRFGPTSFFKGEWLNFKDGPPKPRPKPSWKAPPGPTPENRAAAARVFAEAREAREARRKQNDATAEASAPASPPNAPCPPSGPCASSGATRPGKRPPRRPNT